jgi:hypothetical protein
MPYGKTPFLKRTLRLTSSAAQRSTARDRLLDRRRQGSDGSTAAIDHGGTEAEVQSACPNARHALYEHRSGSRLLEIIGGETQDA